MSYRNRKGFESYDFKLSLSSEDIEHLYLFKSYLKSNHVIRQYDIKDGFNTTNKEARLLICNKNFGKNLYDKYGLIPHRHNTYNLIRSIPYQYRYDFIRGIFDAEGTLIKKYIKYKKTEAYEYSIGFCTYEELLLYINNIFIKDGLTTTRYKLSKRHENGDLYCSNLRITGNGIVLKILEKIYEDSENLNLARKYSRYIDMIQYIQVKGDM